MNILVTIPDTNLRRMFFTEDTSRRLELLGAVRWNPHSRQYSRDEIVVELKNADACITGWHAEKLYSDMIDERKLRSISHVGGSVTDVAAEEIFALPLVVTNANDAFGTTVAETTLMLLMMSFRDINTHIAKMREPDGYWVSPDLCVRKLSGKTVGILGYGAISKELIRLLLPFRTETLVYSKHCPPETARREGFILIDLDDLFARADAMVPLNTLTPETYHLVNRERLRKLKDDAIIVNTGRGAVIDEDALIAELSAGRLFAALDVYEDEPLPGESALRSLPNVVCIPYMGGKTHACRERMGSMVVDDVEKIASGSSPEHVVTLDLYRRMSQKIR